MRFFNFGKNKHKSLIKIEQDQNNTINIVKPELALGISIYNEPITDDIKKMLTERFSGKCDVCGVSLDKKMTHHHNHNKVWYNSCGMCYFSENLDLIDFYMKGKIIYLPDISQARLNAIMRGIWSLSFFDKISSDNEDAKELQSALVELGDFIERRAELKSIVGFSETDVASETDILCSFLGLLKPDEYNERHKLLTSCRWLPDPEMFEDEMVYWAQNDYLQLHPDKINDNITKFVKENIPNFKIA